MPAAVFATLMVSHWTRRAPCGWPQQGAQRQTAQVSRDCQAALGERASFCRSVQPSAQLTACFPAGGL